ncbi:MAG: NADH-quinone oxidoreductase subunit J [Chitinophagales bacterium]
MIAFTFLSALAVLSAIGVMGFRNVFHASLSLTLCFLALGGLFLSLGAEFLAVVQLVIYVGAIAVIIVFAVMLTPPAIGHSNQSNRLRLPAALVTLVTLGVLTGSLSGARIPPPGLLRAASVAQIGELMLTRYAVPFEVAGLLLLIALVAAIAVAKEALHR